MTGSDGQLLSATRPRVYRTKERTGRSESLRGQINELINLAGIWQEPPWVDQPQVDTADQGLMNIWSKFIRVEHDQVTMSVLPMIVPAPSWVRSHEKWEVPVQIPARMGFAATSRARA